METVVLLRGVKTDGHINVDLDVEKLGLKSKEKSHIPVDVDMDEYRGIEDGIQNNTL